MLYYNAIEGVISDWATDILPNQERLSTITDVGIFERTIALMDEHPLYIERNSKGNGMYKAALNKYLLYLRSACFKSNNIEDDLFEIYSRSYLEETEKRILVRTRIGQGQFRSDLIHYWKGCAVTGYSDTKLLRASHIKPWSQSSNTERLDVFNGLLLIPNLDISFDSGLISFDENGHIIISRIMEDPGKVGVSMNLSAKTDVRHEAYLKYHRENVFLK